MSRKNQFTNFDWSQIPFERFSRGKKREMLFSQANFACEKCSFSKLRDDGRSILEIDHIDGDHSNNERSNLRVLCPNCHAMTPTYKNFKRVTEKPVKRFRRENKGYTEARALLKLREQLYIENFKKVVFDSFNSNEINFSKFGWVQKLSEKLNDPCPQAVAKRLRKLLPEFAANCFFRGRKRI